eukprot:scaffold1090_cov265-Pinguiococcus_pyrenoidosus.AAC.27
MQNRAPPSAARRPQARHLRHHRRPGVRSYRGRRSTHRRRRGVRDAEGLPEQSRSSSAMRTWLFAAVSRSEVSPAVAFVGAPNSPRYVAAIALPPAATSSQVSLSRITRESSVACVYGGFLRRPQRASTKGLL